MQVTRTEALCRVLGWQGGTIHQIAAETGCTVEGLLYGEAKETHLLSDNTKGWFAVRTCPLEYNRAKIFPKYKGNLEFWLGAACGMQLQMADERA